MDRVAIPLTFKPIEIGRFKIEKEAIIEILGEPHFVETDGTRTAGGEEWFWAFEDRTGIFAYLYRQPYEECNILSKRSNVAEVVESTSKVFPNEIIEVYVKPYEHR